MMLTHNGDVLRTTATGVEFHPTDYMMSRSADLAASSCHRVSAAGWAARQKDSNLHTFSLVVERSKPGSGVLMGHRGQQAL